MDLRIPGMATTYDSPQARELRRVMGIVTEQELADALEVTTSTLSAWRGKDTGPRPVHLGKSVYYQISEVKQWVERSQLGPDR